MTTAQIIMAILGGIAALATVVTAIVKLATVISKLNTTMEMFADMFKTQKCENERAHDELRGKVDDHGGKLADHETRIQIIERTPKRRAVGT